MWPRARVCVFVCGLHMLPITSPICVNHHKRRNRVRHSDYDLKDMREEGEPVTGPARHRRQTGFTHTGFGPFCHALHWLSSARRLQIIQALYTLCSLFARLLIHTDGDSFAVCPTLRKNTLKGSSEEVLVVYVSWDIYLRRKTLCKTRVFMPGIFFSPNVCFGAIKDVV